MGLRVKRYGPHSQQLADGRLVIDHKDLAAAYPQKVSPLAAAEAAAYRGSAEAAAHRAPMKAAESAGAHPSARRDLQGRALRNPQSRAAQAVTGVGLDRHAISSANLWSNAIFALSKGTPLAPGSVRPK
jgi:hypothetical protein